MSDSLNDIKWKEIFDKFHVLDRISEENHFEITSAQINEFGREARLMTKFDHKSQLPKLFADNHLSILPVSRGSYVIGTFEAFCDFNTEGVGVSSIGFPTLLESLDYKDITSEATAINCAFVSKILCDFTEEEKLCPTVSGRMGSGAFSFTINTQNDRFNVNVKNSQLEIDAGYEGDRSLLLIEAKNDISDDFLVRQLYYPYRLWTDKIHKKVRSIFLTYTNGIFHLREYDFTDTNHYNSLVLVKHRKYAIQESRFNAEVLLEMLDQTEIVSEPTHPFPQADGFERIINLCELLKQKDLLSNEQITQNYDFTERQTNYYASAASYLGLVKTGHEPSTKQTGYRLTRKGQHIFGLSLPERQKEFVKLIVSHSVFKKVVKNHLDTGEMPSKETIVETMRTCGIRDMKSGKAYSDKTYHRRALTIVSWVNWITGQMEE